MGCTVKGMDNEVTPDGCSVEVYRHLPGNGEPELIDSAIRPNSTILEFGCGTGRLANALAGMGHRVTGVDESAAMLSHLRGVTPVQGRIESVDLGERFDVVVLAANLISTVEDRGPFVAACARHLVGGGVLVGQWLSPAWFDDVIREREREGDLGIVRGRLRVIDVTRARVGAETTYQIDGRLWSQRFDAYRLSEPELAAELGAAGLRLDRWLDEKRGWFTAIRVIG